MPINDCESAKRTAFFVEGETELLALRQHFGIRARKIGLYGHNVEMAQVGKKISVSLITEEPERVFIMFDREARRESSSELRDQLNAILVREFPEIDFHIAIPDRDIEAWIFADVEICGRHFKKAIGAKARFEGENGAQKIKNYIGQGAYDKTDDGVKLLSKVRWSKIMQRSASARLFAVQDFFDDCAWLAK